MTPGAEPPRLVRAIGRWDLTAGVVNGTIGSSIFGMPAVLAALTGAWSPLAALLAGLGILAITLCHAETASRFREPGGTYLYAREAYGRHVGFQAGWLSFWIRVTSMGANLNVFVDYLGQFAPAVAAGTGRAAVMCVVAALVTALNVIGVRLGARTVDLFTVAKLLPLILLVVLGVGRISGEVLATQAVAAPDWTQAVLLLIFAYGGFEAALVPASEAKDPRRDSAFALLTALAIVAGTYMLVQLTVVGLVPHVAASKAPVAAAFGVLLGPAGVSLAILAAMISTYGWTVGAVLTSPRILYSMGGARRAAVDPRPRASAVPHARTSPSTCLPPRGWPLRCRAASPPTRPSPPSSASSPTRWSAPRCPSSGGGRGWKRRASGFPPARGSRWSASASASGFSPPAPSPRPGSWSR